jgi:hypothetical protein
MAFKNFYLHPEYARRDEPEFVAQYGSSMKTKGREYWLRWLEYFRHEVHEDGSISILGQLGIPSSKTKFNPRERIAYRDKAVVSFAQDRTITHIPFKFKKVVGTFSIEGSGITSLEGCPEIVTGMFNCSNTKLENLKNSPLVGESFHCDSCGLTSLEGSPEIVPYIFSCDNNKITSLEGGPKEVGSMFIKRNGTLKNLKGAPVFKPYQGSKMFFVFTECPNLDDLAGLPYTEGLEYKYDTYKFSKEEIEKAKNSSRIHAHLDQEEKDVFGGIF